MRENRNAIYITFVLTIVSLMCAIAITYFEGVAKLFLQPQFIADTMLSIFTGSILALVIAIVNYQVIKRKELVEYANYINCLVIKIMPIYNLFRNNGERNIEYEITNILLIYDTLVEGVHIKANSIFFLLPNTRLEKQLNEILDSLAGLYKKVMVCKFAIDQYKFSCITEKEVDAAICELFMFLRNDDRGDMYTNTLSDMHKELLQLSKLKYEKSEKIDF